MIRAGTRVSVTVCGARYSGISVATMPADFIQVPVRPDQTIVDFGHAVGVFYDRDITIEDSPPVTPAMRSQVDSLSSQMTMARRFGRLIETIIAPGGEEWDRRRRAQA